MLIPDIAAHSLVFMNFFFHIENGHAAVEEFWAAREVARGDWIGLAYFEPPGLSAPHTVSIQWKRSGTSCSDVRLAIDAAPAEGLEYPLSENYRISERDFKDFFNYARQQEVSGILSRYGALMNAAWIPRDQPKSRITRFAMDTLNEDQKPVLSVDFQRSADKWLVVLQPAWLLKFLDKPVDDEFFVAPLQTAVTLVTPLLKDKADAQ